MNNYLNYNGIERYIKDSFNDEIYIKNLDNEIYAFNFSKQREYFAQNYQNREFYANRWGNEVYPISTKSGFEIFININGQQIYAKDKFGNEKYPLNASRKEKIAKKKINDTFIYYYATLANGEEIYPVDDLRTEYMFENNKQCLIATKKDGNPKVPFSRNGSIKYRTINNKQILYEHNNNIFFGKDLSGNEIYPLNENNIEYYPINGLNLMIAKDADGIYKYALNKDRKIIFPKEKNIEFYIKDDNGNTHSILQKQSKNFYRYILSNKYPTKKTKYGITEIIINNMYTDKYPIDSQNNEYTNQFGELIKPLGNPITNDDFIIITNVNNSPGKHIIKQLLYRPDFNTYDFLTNIKGTRTNNKPIGTLMVLNIPNNSRSLQLYIIIGGLAVLILFLLICVMK